MDFIVLSLGSNQGERAKNLEKASKLLQKNGMEIIKSSSVYESEPVGFSDQGYFLNQVLLIESSASPEELLKIFQDIEKDMGRVRFQKNGPRIIDIDLLFCKDQLVSSEDLMIPHPEIQDRRFVLEPLSEIIPDQIHPIFGSSIKELLDECEDTHIVESSK